MEYFLWTLLVLNINFGSVTNPFAKRSSVMGFLNFKCVFIFFSWLLVLASSSSSSSFSYYVVSNVFTFGSFNVSPTTLPPCNWRYIRVKLPPFYSSTSIVINTDVSLVESIVAHLTL
ncbi:Uncharacterized protein TCM_016296 [Theobroma cacao]|uniref:Uncharacterized protein n=1 Tax=Theobroma cacao TaxID=3641 RepID=A0A061G4L7_THECC|nr:Uncharacterized protein TCM_016296 [Theobroma cacao]